MLRTKLMTAAAAVALFAAPAAFAQDAVPAQPDPSVPALPETPAEATTQVAPAAQPLPAPAAEATVQAEANTVVDALRANGQFTTLLTALDAAQLTETLASRPAISIFAPTDAAFAALPEAERTRLMDPVNVNELRQLLLYHVVVADVNSSQIEGARGGVETAAGAQVLLDGSGDGIKVDGATVTQADIDASNGAVFAIDKVLNPAQSQAAMGDTEAADETEADAAPADETAPAEDVTDEAAAPADATTVTETTAPAQPGDTAPTGEPAAVTTTTAAPPVANPTDGQTDPAATPPVDTPDAADDDGAIPTPDQPQA